MLHYMSLLLKSSVSRGKCQIPTVLLPDAMTFEWFLLITNFLYNSLEYDLDDWMISVHYGLLGLLILVIFYWVLACLEYYRRDYWKISEWKKVNSFELLVCPCTQSLMPLWHRWWLFLSLERMMARKTKETWCYKNQYLRNYKHF